MLDAHNTTTGNKKLKIKVVNIPDNGTENIILTSKYSRIVFHYLKVLQKKLAAAFRGF